MSLMESTGCTLKEAVDALLHDKPVSTPPCVSGGQQPITEYGSAGATRSSLEGDIYRPQNYGFVEGQKDFLTEDAGFGDHRLAPFEAAAKEQVQATVREHMAPANAGKFRNGIHTAMTADANRGTFILNGTVYAYRPAGEVISAFKALVPDPKAQKTLSGYMNQLCFETLLMPTSHLPLSTGTDAIHLPGAGAVVNRDMTSGLYLTTILSTDGHGATHDLELSEDGRTATITQTISADLAAPESGKNDKDFFGAVSISQRIVIDLAPDVPVVTDYKLSQTLS